MTAAKRRPTMTKDERFFYDHAGYSYTPGEETKQEGRRRTARELADSEAWARNEGIEFEWNIDQCSDSSDYEVASHHRWFAYPGRHTTYAMTSIRETGRRSRLIRLHRLILSLSHSDSRQVDHRDGNGLNNTRDNLRICDTSTNLHGVMRGPRGTSQYRGVCWNKSANRWEVRLSVHGKRIVIGYYQSEIEAAEAYDSAKLRMIGPDCQLSGLKY